MEKSEKTSKAVADAIGEFLRIAGDQTKALAAVDLMLVVEADSCRGSFKAMVWSKAPEVPVEAVAPAAAEAAAEAPKSGEELKVEKPVSEAPLRKGAQILPYLA
jgi:hypothetical protein